MGIDSAANLIIESAQLYETSTDSTLALEAMERLSLTKRIHATLLKNNLNHSVFRVEVPEKGIAQISGLAYSEGEKVRAIEIVKGVPGISEVQSEVLVVPEPYD
jgi:osmotically-inducible protein OsmY